MEQFPQELLRGVPLIASPSNDRVLAELTELRRRVEFLEDMAAQMGDGYAVFQRLLMTKGVTLQQIHQYTSQLTELHHFVSVLRDIVASQPERFRPTESNPSFDFVGLLDVFVRLPKSYRPTDRPFYLTVTFVPSAKSPTEVLKKLYMVVGVQKEDDAVMTAKPQKCEAKGEAVFNAGMLHLILMRQAGVSQAFGADLCSVRFPEHVAKWFQLFNWQALMSSYTSVVPQEGALHAESVGDLGSSS